VCSAKSILSLVRRPRTPTATGCRRYYRRTCSERHSPSSLTCCACCGLCSVPNATGGRKFVSPKAARLLHRTPGPAAPHGRRLANRTRPARSDRRMAGAFDDCAPRDARAVASKMPFASSVASSPAIAGALAFQLMSSDSLWRWRRRTARGVRSASGGTPSEARSDSRRAQCDATCGHGPAVVVAERRNRGRRSCTIMPAPSSPATSSSW
jgi:hypothetical protein